MNDSNFYRFSIFNHETTRNNEVYLKKTKLNGKTITKNERDNENDNEK